ncbi:uncharacterized protein LOC134795207 [Cydia splendana]|uniref:uncharacterized protein LOC134795207 n=1 Tax=Cydia splendana TaxID=1100963 RepID=UPI00300D31BE
MDDVEGKPEDKPDVSKTKRKHVSSESSSSDSDCSSSSDSSNKKLCTLQWQKYFTILNLVESFRTKAFVKRAEVINMRRNGITKHIKEPLLKAVIRKIPPSSSSLFNAEAFTAKIEHHGGMSLRALQAFPRREQRLTNRPRRAIAITHMQATLSHVMPRHARKMLPRSRICPSGVITIIAILRKDIITVDLRLGPAVPFADVDQDNSKSHKISLKLLENEELPPRGTDTIREVNIDMRFRAGRLAQFYSIWENMNAPDHVLQMLKGYRIPFLQKPPLVYPNRFDNNLKCPQSDEMSHIINQMKEQGVLEVVDPSPSFISTMFIVPKSDGSPRPIFNLKALNRYVMAENFGLINVHRVPNFIQPKDWLCKIDLSQAYFHLPISPSHRRFLRLIYGQEFMQMTCLPFGLSTAPKTFATFTNWIAQVLRDMNIRIIVYLDDFLIAHQDKNMLARHVEVVVRKLETLGWLINYQKSQLTPQKALIYLGVWDAWRNQKRLPDEKIPILIGKIQQMLSAARTNRKTLERLVGLLNFASFTVPRGRLNYRALLNLLNSVPRFLSETFAIPDRVKADLMWWLHHCRTPSPIHLPPPSHFLTTDASDLAWGAQLDDQALTGFWTKSEQTLHCNQKEMLAVQRVLEGHCQYLSNSTVLVQCDNKTVLAYLRNQGGTKSNPLLELTFQIFCILEQYHIHLNLVHIPGKYNSHADHLSRLRQTPEWHLLPGATEKVFSKWGVPQIDLFASHRAHVVMNYASLDQNDPTALFHDAFSQVWNYNLAWVFPPPYLVPKVLAHLNQATGVYLLVVPRWSRVYWRADIRSRAQAAPFTLRSLEKFLIDVTTGLPPPKVQDMVLEVWKCGGGQRT